MLGLGLLITAVFATKSDALSITMLILGGVLSIATATVTRADELKMTKDGIEAKLSSIAGLDPAGYAVTFRAAEPLPVGNPDRQFDNCRRANRRCLGRWLGGCADDWGESRDVDKINSR